MTTENVVIVLDSYCIHHCAYRSLTGQDHLDVQLILPQSKQVSVDKIRKLYWNKIEQLQLLKIISLVCEIKFMKLFGSSTTLQSINRKVMEGNRSFSNPTWLLG